GGLDTSKLWVTDQGMVKLTDFVLSRKMRSPSASGPTADAFWAQAFQAPEMGGASPQGDVWGLGVAIYEMLCGMVPFPAPSPQAKATRAFAKAGSLVPGLPASMDMLFHRALDPDPRSRISLEEFSTLMEEADRALSSARH
ncbi:MAG: protein kinase, partial [Elusimicrobiota bacterium]